MEARSPVRFLAPIALVVTLAGTYLIVHHSAGHHRSATASQHPGTSTAHQTRHHHGTRARFYSVQQGDNLTTIANKVRIPLPILEGLNAGLDPNSLQTGQRIRLRR